MGGVLVCCSFGWGRVPSSSVSDSLSESAANRLGDRNEVDASLGDGWTLPFLFDRCVVWKACRVVLVSLMVVVVG